MSQFLKSPYQARHIHESLLADSPPRLLSDYDRCESFASDALKATASSMAGSWFEQHSRALGGGAAPIRVVRPSSERHRPYVARAHVNGQKARRSTAPCPKRDDVGALNSVLQRASRAVEGDAPCCNTSEPEGDRLGRCAWYADRGECDQWRRICHVACDVCAVCPGHPQRQKYLSVWRRMRVPPLAARRGLRRDTLSTVV